MKKNNRMKILRGAFLIVVAIFLARYFYRNMDDILALDLTLRPLPFAVSILFYCIYKMTQASLWHYITCINDASIGYRKAVKAYLYSILGKYIPGKVFMLLARIPPYKEEGVSADKVTVCFLLENCCTILGAALLFVVSILFFPNEVLGGYKWTAFVLIAVFFVCIHPKILNYLLALLERVSRKKMMRIPMSYAQILKVVLLFVLNWLAYGFGFYMLVCSICPLPLCQRHIRAFMYRRYPGGVFPVRDRSKRRNPGSGAGAYHGHELCYDYIDCRKTVGDIGGTCSDWHSVCGRQDGEELDSWKRIQIIKQAGGGSLLFLRSFC